MSSFFKDKIFCIGSCKTGTTSIARALQKFESNHCAGRKNFTNKWLPLILENKYEGLFLVIDKYDSFDDLPFAHGEFYKVLYEKYPSAKFILTERDPEDWYCSTLNEINSKGDSVGFRKHVSSSYGGDAFVNKERKQEIKQIFEKRNSSIKTFFKDDPDKLLVLNLNTDDKTKSLILKKFLGSSKDIGKFPHVNKSKRKR